MPLTSNLNNTQPSDLLTRYQTVRQYSETLCEPLVPEDYVVQSMPDVSPTKWHLAHVTWFFETFVLPKAQPNYQPYHADYAFLFNSYYVSVGERHARPQRGLLSRPTVTEIYAYRAAVDAAMHVCLERGVDDDIAALVELGLNHEQQHQELLLMDIKHVLSCNPLKPAYRAQTLPLAEAHPIEWLSTIGGIYEMGRSTRDNRNTFCFDNETPKHRVFVDDMQIANRCVTNAEWLAFINDNGYQTPSLWLSDGWDWLQQQQISAPLYWRFDGDQWWEFTLAGEHPVVAHAPVAHISFYEAEAYATWAGARLPTEAEWEISVMSSATSTESKHAIAANHALHPTGTSIIGDVWQWTRSNYAPYPGFKPLAGSLGEYNGKFMNNQYVLKGGSCATPPGHYRHSYRNFFYPHMRWQFAGIRLAKHV